jgi:hypothetical protein
MSSRPRLSGCCILDRGMLSAIIFGCGLLSGHMHPVCSMHQRRLYVACCIHICVFPLRNVVWSGSAGMLSPLKMLHIVLSRFYVCFRGFVVCPWHAGFSWTAVRIHVLSCSCVFMTCICACVLMACMHACCLLLGRCLLSTCQICSRYDICSPDAVQCALISVSIISALV